MVGDDPNQKGEKEMKEIFVVRTKTQEFVFGTLNEAINCCFDNPGAIVLHKRGSGKLKVAFVPV